MCHLAELLDHVKSGVSLDVSTRCRRPETIQPEMIECALTRVMSIKTLSPCAN